MTKDFDCYVNVPNGTNNDYGHVWIFNPGSVQQANTVQSRHHELSEHEIESFPGVKQCKCFQSSRRFETFIASLHEHGDANFAYRLFTVNDKNASLRDTAFCAIDHDSLNSYTGKNPGHNVPHSIGSV
jgi:hypothetical protein